ncbi:M28 family peptidase [Consotaella aegiceratis]|uniref:M28 family peptidase n=1 Tax=Consotaella aegiceratis TaxID=3097961 RepID=UPI002F42D2E9
MEHSDLPCADADELMRTAAALCALGEKRSGSDEEAKAAEIICDRLRSYGLQPIVEEHDNYVGYPTRTELRFGGPDGEPVEAVGVAFGGATSAEGLTAELIGAGTGKAADYASIDVEGKAALVRGLPTYGVVKLALQHGAAAVICMSDGPQRHKMTLSPVWGSPASEAELARMPRLPVASINKPDGERLAEAAVDGGRIHLVAEHFEGWRKVRLPVLDIPGREPEFLLLGSHYCTWFDGSTDNITANALLVEVARLMAQKSEPRRYGLRLAWWPGHTHGRYSGSGIYADTHWRDLRDKAILYFNVDSVGTREATLCLARNQMAEIGDFSARMLEEMVEPLSPQDQARFERQWKRPEPSGDITRPSRSSDQSFWGVGLTSLQIVSMLPATATPTARRRSAAPAAPGGGTRNMRRSTRSAPTSWRATPTCISA